MNETADVQLFKSFSRNLSRFLNNEGIFPVSKGVHTTGVQISPDSGKTWDDFTNFNLALEKYYHEYDRQLLEELIAESFRLSSPVAGPGTTMVRKRVRYFEEYEVNDRLQVALKRWKESGPNKK